MQRRTGWIILIVLVVAAAIYVVIPGTGLNFTFGTTTVNYQFVVHEGLDLQGGLQVLLEADVPNCNTVELEAMQAAQTIVERRVNALGLTEPLVQRQGTCRIVVELPGVTDSEQAIATLKQTGLLEFVEAGTQFLDEGTRIETDCADPAQVDCGAATGATLPTPATSLTDTITGTANAQRLHTVMTGAAIKDASVTTQNGKIVIAFSLTDEGSKIFSAFTTQHVGEVLAIVLDKAVISAPRINSAITDGSGIIEGRFTSDTANQLAIQLRYGSLPVPLRVAQSREIGPTLGQDSVRKSAVAGVIGMAAVVLFMALYYRLPGLIASVALGVYAVITFAIFKGGLFFIGIPPVTLTLPGIAGFVLSVGVAVDANILIFERLKEELRNGKSLQQAVEAGFTRAWPSIRDSNISTLITCLILFIFGSNFGASVVKGFAVTLALGVFVSLFTAITVTRTILHLFLDRIDFSEKHSWFGI